MHLGAGLGRADALDGGDGAIANRSDRQKTRAHRVAVDMHGAGATLRDAAAVFGARHAKHIAQHPQERGVTVDIDVVCRTVDFDGKGHGELLSARTISETQVFAPGPEAS